MTRCVIVDRFLTPAETLAASARWPADDWQGWHEYGEQRGGKRASDLSAPLPWELSAALARMAQAHLGALVGMPDSVADLSLFGGGLHEHPRGAGLAKHLDADTHARLGLARAWSAVLWVHPFWGADWGGELEVRGVPPVAPLPGRLCVFDCREAEHRVAPVRCPPGASRRSLALFGYGPAPGANARPRAVFDGERVGGGVVVPSPG